MSPLLRQTLEGSRWLRLLIGRGFCFICVCTQVLDFRPAVVCLQEVDEDKYEGVFRKKLVSTP